MRYRPLGRSDVDVSVICLGTMTWGGRNSEAEGHAQLDLAVERGVNFVDVAEMYPSPVSVETWGRSEEILGSWLAGDKARRDRLVIATKVTGPSKFAGIRGDIHPEGTRLDRQSVIRACEASLRRLGVDCIDLYQIHWPARPVNKFGRLGYEADEGEGATPIAETMDALGELRRTGKIRFAGLSNDTPWGLHRCLMAAEKSRETPRMATVQNPYSLLCRTYEAGLSEFAYREGVGLLAYAPLAGGMLSGKYLNGRQPPGARMTTHPEYYSRYRTTNGYRATERYVDIARRHGLDPATMAHAFVVSRGFVTASIVGATDLEQLETAVAAADVDLSEAVQEEIAFVGGDIVYPCP